MIKYLNQYLVKLLIDTLKNYDYYNDEIIFINKLFNKLNHKIKIKKN